MAMPEHYPRILRKEIIAKLRSLGEETPAVVSEYGHQPSYEHSKQESWKGTVRGALDLLMTFPKDAIGIYVIRRMGERVLHRARISHTDNGTHSRRTLEVHAFVNTV